MIPSQDLYFTGESYAGQYVPNIAHFILNNEPFTSRLNLKGLALGNACWGGNETLVECNGPNSHQNMADIYYGKGMSSKELYEEIYETCNFPEKPDVTPNSPNYDFELTEECEALLSKQTAEVGPHNVSPQSNLPLLVVY